MNIFLRQEIDRMQRVITAVRSTLVDLKLAIDGTIIMSENLKDALDNIYDARVPAFWKKVSKVNAQIVFSGKTQLSLKELRHDILSHFFDGLNNDYRTAKVLGNLKIVVCFGRRTPRGLFKNIK